MKMVTARWTGGSTVRTQRQSPASFEQQMARGKELSGANVDDSAMIEYLAKKMRVTTVFSAGQAAEAMSYFCLGRIQDRPDYGRSGDHAQSGSRWSN